MTEPQESAAQHRRLVASLAPGLAAADELEQACHHHGSLADVQVDLSFRSVRGRVPAEGLARLAPSFAAAAASGHRVTAATHGPGPSLTVTWLRTGRTDVELDGSADELAGTRAGPGLQQAVDRDDGPAALATLAATAAADLDVHVLVAPDVAGAAWAASAAELAARLADGRWGSTLLRLGAGAGGTALVVVQDAGADVLRCPGLVLAGPTAGPDRLGAAPGPRLDGDVQYREARTRSGHLPLPAPAALVPDPAPDGAGALEPLRAPLAAAARATCWYWLGRDSVVTPDTVTTTFQGARPVQLELLPRPADHDAGPETALYGWAAAAADPVRDDAVHQAVSFAVRDQTDLPGAAGPVLRTARSLFELAGRGAVAEALAARRAAREAAVAAAHAAATAAREVAGKSIERALAFLVAAAAAVFANAKDVLGTPDTVAVLIGAACLAVLALVVALTVELPSGAGILNAADTDAELYREALGQDDLDAVRDLAATKAARDDLRRARTTAILVYLGVAVAIAAAGAAALAIASGPDARTTPPPTPTPTGSPAASSPTGTTSPNTTPTAAEPFGMTAPAPPSR